MQCSYWADENIMVCRLGLQYVEDFKQRISRSEAEELIKVVSDAADKAYGPKQAFMMMTFKKQWFVLTLCFSLL